MGIWQLVRSLRLFLFEEAAESAYGVGGILSLRQCLGGTGGGSTGAAKLRPQHASRKTANIRNEFWIRSRAMNQERHGCRTPFASTGGARDLCQEAANAACGATSCAAHSASHRVGERCHHFEIEIVLGIDRASTHETSQSGNDGDEIFGSQPVRRHPKVRGDLLDVQVLAGLDASDHRDGGHFRSEIKVDQLRAVKADGAGGDEFVGGTAKSEIRVECPALKRSTLWKMDAQGGKKRLEILCRHVLPFHLDVNDSGLAGGCIGAMKARRGAADLERGGIEDAGVLAEIVVGIEIHSEGDAGGRTTSDEQGFGKFSVALGFSLAAFRLKCAVEIEKAPESHGGIEETGRGEIQRADIELGAKRSQCRVGLIDRANNAIELELAAGREIGGDGDRKLRLDGNVRGSNVDVVVGATPLRIRGADDDAAVFERELLDGEVRGRVRRTRRFCGRAAERRIVPEPRGIVKEGYLRAINRDARDIQGLRENQRNHFNTDLEGFGGEERRRAEFGIVANGKIFGGERAADQREAHVPELHFAAERGRSFFFDGGAELIDGNQERHDENQDDQNADNNEDDAELALHDDLQDSERGRSPGRRQGGWPCNYMPKGGGTGLSALGHSQPLRAGLNYGAPLMLKGL